MTGVTYDTGALVAAERGSAAMWALHRRLLDRDVMPTVPACVLAQAWRGAPQPLLSRLLRGCAVQPFDEAWARRVGRACGLAGTSDVVDAAVVVGALVRRDMVVSGDEGGLERLASALGGALWIHRV